MGLYYTLNNGETIEIAIESETELNDPTILIKLFGGTTVFYHDYYEKNDLNKIIADIEKDYDRLKREDKDFEIRCYTD